MLYLVGLRDLWLLVFAFLVSGAIAMVALDRTREGAAYGITSAVRGLNERIETSKRAEDDDLPDAPAATTAPPGPGEPDAASTAGPDAASPDTAGPDTASPDAAGPDTAAPLDEWDDPAPR